MEHLTVWAHARENIRPQMTGLSFHAWIDSLVPLTLRNGVLVLEAPNQDILKTLKDFYFPLLYEAVRSASDEVEDVLLVLPEDRDQYVAPEDAEPVNVYALNPKYTFDSFVVGSSNQFPHAAAQAVAYAFRRAEISLVLSSLTGGLVCSAVTMLAFYLFGLSPASVETILSGAIMPLISGLMMTNAVRDALRGDLLSAMARGMEALLVAVMVALGISLLLRFYLPVEVEPLAEPGWAMAVVTAGLATLFFCPLLDAPPRAMAPSALLGMVSYGLYLALRDAAMVGETLSLFFTAAAIALLCALMARRMRMITTIFLCAAMIPLVPGLGLFRTMRALLLAQYDMAISAGLQTLFAVGAIALGAALGSMRLHKPKRARPEKER